jgi:hypothetical protein
MIAGVMAKIWTKYLQNASLEHYCTANLLSFITFVKQGAMSVATQLIIPK